MNEPRQTPTWKKVLAAILDFFTIFLGAGYLIALLTGNISGTGFELEGGPALILFLAIIAYFVIGHKYAGGTVWRRILR